ncbi:MAG: hydroxymethylglutaryl-CoA lyase [Cyclobacteriaceae bacterium]|jgi:hydroxymethylglutaryl-CoA lyase
MQGIEEWIPTEQKVAYINQLLSVGFDVLDFGSFVSPKSIPQMRDTAEVLSQLDLSNTKTELLAIIANERGATEACQHQQISYLGFPFSVSEEFQLRNTNSSRAASLERVKYIAELADSHNKELVIYLSMGFGNPYGEAWSPEIVLEWTAALAELGISRFAISDTIGDASPTTIGSLYTQLTTTYPNFIWGAHLHTTPTAWEAKIIAAYEAGCRRFDGAIKGYGGCPMASDELTGNMPTEKMIEYFEKTDVTKISQTHLLEAITSSQSVFPF